MPRLCLKCSDALSDLSHRLCEHSGNERLAAVASPSAATGVLPIEGCVGRNGWCSTECVAILLSFGSAKMWSIRAARWVRFVHAAQRGHCRTCHQVTLLHVSPDLATLAQAEQPAPTTRKRMPRVNGVSEPALCLAGNCLHASIVHLPSRLFRIRARTNRQGASRPDTMCPT